MLALKFVDKLGRYCSGSAIGRCTNTVPCGKPIDWMNVPPSLHATAAAAGLGGVQGACVTLFTACCAPPSASSALPSASSPLPAHNNTNTQSTARPGIIILRPWWRGHACNLGHAIRCAPRQTLAHHWHSMPWGSEPAAAMWQHCVRADEQGPECTAQCCTKDHGMRPFTSLAHPHKNTIDSALLHHLQLSVGCLCVGGVLPRRSGVFPCGSGLLLCMLGLAVCVHDLHFACSSLQLVVPVDVSAAEHRLCLAGEGGADLQPRGAAGPPAGLCGANSDTATQQGRARGAVSDLLTPRASKQGAVRLSRPGRQQPAGDRING